MSVVAPRIPLNVPGIPVEHLDATEREGVEALNNKVIALKNYADVFGDALALFDHSHEQLQVSEPAAAELLNRWKLLAARDGAMTILLFCAALENATRLLIKQQNSLTNFEPAKIRSAWLMLVSLMPQFESVRQAGTRVGELTSDPDLLQQHVGSGTDDHAAASHAAVLTGRKYQNSYDGKLQTYQMNRRTYEGLVAVAKEFYSAFGNYNRGAISSQDFFWRVRPD
jgi:hypothetical protein